MTDDQKKQLEQKLWNIANALRGKMNADEFRDYCLGFIFYKYLSEKLLNRCNDILKDEEGSPEYQHLDENDDATIEIIDYLKDEILGGLGYFLKPSELFSNIAQRGAHKEEGNGTEKNAKQEITVDAFILGDLQEVLNNPASPLIRGRS